MRSNYYIATVINTYRNAIDDYYDNKLTNDKIKYYKKILDRVANRDSVCQFFDKFPDKDAQYFLGRQEVSNQDFLGLVINYDEENKEAIITQRNYFKLGDTIEVFGPNIETFSFTVDKMFDEEGTLIEIANHPEQVIRIKLDKKVYKDDILRVKI